MDQGHEMVQLVKMLDRTIARRAAKISQDICSCELSMTEMFILGYLEHHAAQALYQKDIEAEFHIARSTVTKLLKNMEALGYVTRDAVSSDARLKQIQLTDRAREFHERVHSTLHEQIDRPMLDGIEEEKLNVFREVLMQMHQNLTKGERHDKDTGGADQRI